MKDIIYKAEDCFIPKNSYPNIIYDSKKIMTVKEFLKSREVRVFSSDKFKSPVVPTREGSLSSDGIISINPGLFREPDHSRIARR